MSVNIKIPTTSNQERTRINILCLDITSFSQKKQFIFCSVAVFAFFLIYGYMQELIFTIDGFEEYGWFLTLIQFGMYSIFGYLENHVQNIITRKIPIKLYMFLALLTLGTMGFSNTAVGYLNYPTQVIFKCCKLIPVLIGSILIQGKKYGPLDFLSAFIMCLGLILFTLTDSQVSPKFNFKGVIMISAALLCDAIIGNVQEKSMKNYGAPNSEVVMYSYFIGFLYLFSIMLVTGDIQHGLTFYSRDPIRCYGYTFIFSITGYLGIQIVLTLVRTCGAFAAVTVTTCRKAVTIIISFMFFSKPFVFRYVWSGLLVLLGIYLNFFSKRSTLSTSQVMNAIQRKLKYVMCVYKTSKKHKMLTEV
ncbi:adenosine 3'-phospho 5'-phosphosulfate transporter 2 [Agrilus planipennis]|uniref:Adenosine 3'-phospho 5'-phosphosulfate transporter 2 n=1 Tax=Agrilus planipennis TaxID=224129 RepID=A0A7F5RLE2_AGRPL|nr:adenosine 3'-phospho 5'-phosphosulfate transporter 2 [Agrilus planipennis]